MKKVFYFALLLMVIISQGCKGDNDVLATFKEGKITRGEFYKWIDIRRIPKKTILAKKSNQKIRLRQMAIDKIVYNEAIKAGFEKSNEMKLLMDLIKDNVLTGQYIKKVRKNLEFKEKAVKVRIIRLIAKSFKIEKKKRVNLSGDEMKKALNQKMKIADRIIDSLNRNGNFEDLARKHSQDFSKKNGGDIGYIFHGVREPQLVNAAFALKVGEYTKKPVKIGNNIYIIKVEDKTEITNDNIESLISDKNMARRYKRRLQFNIGRNLEKRLLKAGDVKDLTDKADLNKKDDLLFKIGNEEFKVADLENIIDISYKRRFRFNPAHLKIDDKRKRGLAKRILSQKLLVREAKKEGTHKDPEFTSTWEFRKELTIANEYRNKIIMADIKITDQEVKKEYEKNKKRAYSKRVRKGKKTIIEPIPFKDAKQRVTYMLARRKSSFKKRKWEKEIIKNAQFKIDESKLEGK